MHLLVTAAHVIDHYNQSALYITDAVSRYRARYCKTPADTAAERAETGYSRDLRAGAIAFGTGLIRTALASYLLALFVSGTLYMIAALAILSFAGRKAPKVTAHAA